MFIIEIINPIYTFLLKNQNAEIFSKTVLLKMKLGPTSTCVSLSHQSI